MTQQVKIWRNYYAPNGEVHTVPVDDVIVHEYDNCACRPETEAVKRDDGSINWLNVHHAWDGRP